MALTRVECCGRLMSPDEAIEHTRGRDNRCEWTTEILQAMLKTSVAHPSNDDPTRISTTVLTAKCLRQLALARYNDYSEAPGDMWARFRGTMFHGQLEPYAVAPSYAEARFHIDDVGKLIPYVKQELPRLDRSLSGSPDLVDPKVGIVFDYKRTKEVPRFDTAWGDHVEQLNINRWLIDHADRIELRSGEVLDLSDPDVRKLYIAPEWQELVVVYVDDRGPKPITITESIVVPAKAEGKTKRVRVPSVWDDDRVEDLVAERYVAARLALKQRNAPIPAGWEHQSHILCGYCPVRDLCAERERRESLEQEEECA